MKLKLAYFGTPDFSANFLEKILTDKELPIEVKLVVTQPDKPVGKKQIMTASPVKVMAQKYDIKIYNGHNRSLPDLLTNQKIDLCFLFAYGEIIPQELLHIPRLGFWNIHLSLLPKYRGASPVIYPLIMGDQETGITIIKMDELLDHGSIVVQKKTTILAKEKRDELTFRLSKLSFDVFKKEIKKLEEIKPREQNHKDATYTRRLEKNDGFIPFATLKKALNNEPLVFEELPKIIKEYLNKHPSLFGNSAKIIFNFFRGLFPWPGLWTKIKINNQEKRLKIVDLDFVHKRSRRILDLPADTTYQVIQAGQAGMQMLTIKKVQLEGKKEVDFATFNKAYRLFSAPR